MQGHLLARHTTVEIPLTMLLRSVLLVPAVGLSWVWKELLATCISALVTANACRWAGCEARLPSAPCCFLALPLKLSVV